MQPSPYLSVAPVQAIFPLLGTAAPPPAMVVMVYGKTKGAVGSAVGVGKLTVKVIAADADAA
jgi:hypothetical protein